MASPEECARQEIDRLLTAAGWAVQDFKGADLHAARGVALREFEPTHCRWVSCVMTPSLRT